MSLKPFTYPLPETRFLHAGRLVYKFKIRYGNFNSADDLNNTESTVKELEEAIRVILGNLDDLHPFSTEHFTIFPYLSKWERISKMRFKHGDVHLLPYPYICTMYLELNSFQQNISFGKEVHKGSSKLVKERNERSKSTETEGTVKRRRVEDEAETPYPESNMDRTGAGCVHSMSKAEHGFEMNCSKEIQCEYCPASLTEGCNPRNSGGPVECNTEKNTETSQAEGEMQLPQQMDQVRNKGNTELKGRSFSEFWRSILISPLQHLFGGNN
ncbi:membrane-anchored junction protein [Dromaius novaehollandiae]|uniref:membrane-anchored junction protein n=1 Tax=Dromaius novaehollandiae TaxID=8790 RepID=UPI000E1F0276|nr:membrane-anchored junction protein [Dromaius novaehollandiae]